MFIQKLYTFKAKSLIDFIGSCSSCDTKNDFNTSSINNKSFDINNRIVYAMRSCGQGFSGIEKFTSLMNMPKPMTRNNYDKIVKKFVKVSEKVANETMNDAVKELRSEASDSSSDSVIDVSISQNGTWQRRGHSSLNGCVAALSMDTGLSPSSQWVAIAKAVALKKN